MEMFSWDVGPGLGFEASGFHQRGPDAQDLRPDLGPMSLGTEVMGGDRPKTALTKALGLGVFRRCVF